MAIKRPDARAILFERIRTSPPKFVHLVGVPYLVEAEAAAEPEKLDHVWLTIEVPPFGRMRIALNTISRLNRDGGFDPHMQMAIVPSTYAEKPPPGFEEFPGFDYAKMETKQKAHYAPYERDALRELLVAKAKTAVRVEAWGELYASDHIGLRQIHSRRKSSAVKQDLTNRDGAVKLYYAAENAAELLLFKFDGQK